MIGINLNLRCFSLSLLPKYAVLFQDTDIAEQILQSSSPKEQKALGREVHNFDLNEWKKQCRDIVRTGNMAKVRI